MAGFLILGAWITCNPGFLPLWKVTGHIRCFQKHRWGSIYICMVSLGLTEALSALYLVKQAGVHSPAQWNCPQSSQESRRCKCARWQDRWWPSELLLQPTGCQQAPRPELAPAPACLSHINSKAGGVGKHWNELQPSWVLGPLLLWVLLNTGRLYLVPSSPYTMRMSWKALSSLLSLELASSQLCIISLGDLS